MNAKAFRRLPKILKINRIEKNTLRISVLYSNGEDPIPDFPGIFKKESKVTQTDPEYKPLKPREFAKVSLGSHTLSWKMLIFL
jgi:hypothetical protein